MFFEIFEDLKFLKIFDPQFQNFKNLAPAVEISADPKILVVTKKNTIKFSQMRVRIFFATFVDIFNFF